MSKIYLYLAKRDKKGIRILTVFNDTRKQDATRIERLDKLNLPESIKLNVFQAVEENKMLWEPFIESADTFADLVASIKSRGYKNIPFYCSPSVPIQKFSVTKKADIPTVIPINIKEKEKKTMIRKLGSN